MPLSCLLHRRNSFTLVRIQSLIRSFHNLNTLSSPFHDPASSTSFNSQAENNVPSPFVSNSSDQFSSNPFSSPNFSSNATPPTRCYGFLSAEEAAAERRRRKRRLRIEPPIQVGQRPPPPPRDPRQPDSTSALTGPRLNLHNRVQSLIRAFDLDAASVLARSAVYGRTRPTVFTCNAIIAAMHRAKRYEDSKALFKYFFEQNSLIPNVVSYNYLINSLCDEGNVDEALTVYRRIIAEAPFGPSHVTFRHLTKGLIDVGRIDEAVDLLREMLNKGHGADSLVYNNLIKGFLDLGNLERADEFFNELKERCLVYDGVVNATYMEWWFNQGKEKEAMESYKSLLDKKYRMVPATCNVLLGVLVKYGKKSQAWDLFDHMLDDHTPPTFQAVNSETFSIMVNECFKEGKISEAVETFRRAGTKERSRPFAMDVAGYNNMIARFCDNDMPSEAEKYFEELCSKSLNPDVTSFRTLIDAFLRLDMIDDAVRYFTRMVDAGLRVVASYGIVVFEKLIANQKTMECCKILTRMGEKDPKPESCVYEIVVRGVCDAGELDLGKELVSQMMGFNVVVPSSLKEFVLNVFQESGRGDEIESVLDESKWRRSSAPNQWQSRRVPSNQPSSSWGQFGGAQQGRNVSPSQGVDPPSKNGGLSSVPPQVWRQNGRYQEPNGGMNTAHFSYQTNVGYQQSGSLPQTGMGFGQQGHNGSDFSSSGGRNGISHGSGLPQFPSFSPPDGFEHSNRQPPYGSYGISQSNRQPPCGPNGISYGPNGILQNMEKPSYGSNGISQSNRQLPTGPNGISYGSNGISQNMEKQSYGSDGISYGSNGISQSNRQPPIGPNGISYAPNGISQNMEKQSYGSDGISYGPNGISQNIENPSYGPNGISQSNRQPPIAPNGISYSPNGISQSNRQPPYGPNGISYGPNGISQNVEKPSYAPNGISQNMEKQSSGSNGISQSTGKPTYQYPSRENSGPETTQNYEWQYNNQVHNQTTLETNDFHLREATKR